MPRKARTFSIALVAGAVVVGYLGASGALTAGSEATRRVDSGGSGSGDPTSSTASAIVGTATTEYGGGRQADEWNFVVADDGSWGIAGGSVEMSSSYDAESLTLTTAGAGTIDGEPALISVIRGLPPAGPESPRRLLDALVYGQLADLGHDDEPRPTALAGLPSDAVAERAEDLMPTQPTEYEVIRDPRTGFPSHVRLFTGDVLIDTVISTSFTTDRAHPLLVAPPFSSSRLEPTAPSAGDDGGLSLREGPPDATVDDGGFRRVDAEDLAELISYKIAIPRSVGAFLLSGVYYAPVSTFATGAGLNGPSAEVVVARYTDGLREIALTSRLSGPGTWVDPYAGGRLAGTSKTEVITTSTTSFDAVYVEAAEAPRHIWGTYDGLVLTVAGDATRVVLAELLSSAL